MSINKNFSILNFFKDEILHNAANIGVPLGTNSHKVAMSINELLDSEMD